METLEAINNRRSVRKYLDKPVEFEKIVDILDAARKAPSAGNLQEWRYIIVTDRGLIKQVASYAIEQYWIQTAPLLIIVCTVPDKYETYYGLRGKRLYDIQDCAASIENLMLASVDMGLSTCWIGAFEEEKVRGLFGIPIDVRPQAIVSVGYADEAPKEKQLVPIENIVFFNRYGMKVEKLHVVLRDYAIEWQKQGENMKHATNRHIKRIGEEIKRIGGKIKERFKKKDDKNSG